MGSQILKCKISKTLLCLQFISDIQSRVITDARLEYIKLRVRIRDRSAGDWKCLSVMVAFSFLGCREKLGSKERETGSAFHMLCPRYIGPLTPTAPLQPQGCAGILDLYLSRRQCNSRFRCTQLFNTTLHLF